MSMKAGHLFPILDSFLNSLPARSLKTGQKTKCVLVKL